MADTHPGDTERLKRYWSHGKGALKIRWGEPHDFDRCVVQVAAHSDMTPEQVKGYCAERHHDALGIWPATHAKIERGKAAMTTEAKAATRPYGNVHYADPGYLDYQGNPASKSGKTPVARYRIDSAKAVRAAWSYINQQKNASQYAPQQLAHIKSEIEAAAKKFGVTISTSATEAMIAGKWSYSDTREMVRDALRDRIRAAMGTGGYVWCSVVDLTDTDVVYSDDLDCDDLWLCPYTMTSDGVVTLGTAGRVVRTYGPAPAGLPPDDDAPGGPDAMDGDMPAGMSEARVRTLGRVLEAKGADASGGRIFRVRVIRYGDSANGRRYTESVMRAATPLYEGSRVYDHHRTDGEMATGTIAGLAGHIENVTPVADGLEADLHLLPGATHAAQVLAESLTAQDAGRPPLAGISHDVMAHWRPIVDGARHLAEATRIVGVNSVDIVATPAAGGAALRAGETGNPSSAVPAGNTQEDDVPLTTEGVLEALSSATPDQLAAAGLRRAEATAPAASATRAVETTEPAAPEPLYARDSVIGRLLVTSAVEAAQLPATLVESLREGLPERFSEAEVAGRVATLKATLGGLEKAGLIQQLAGTVPTAQVTQEGLDKKIKALDAMFAGDFKEGYRSFRAAWEDITGARVRAFDGDVNLRIMQESVGAFDSARRAAESLTSSSWDVILGDSITRRMVAEYTNSNLSTWRQIVSSTPPINDFRQQKVERLGGYGVLPTVNQGAPYQPLTSPGDEEITYTASKYGGTEDLTLEMIANDDLRAVTRIPVKLGRGAAITLYRFVWDMLANNITCTYDSNALFDNANHANTDTASALSQTTLSVGRKKMQKQAAYGNSVDILQLTPAILAVPSDLEEIAFQLATSAVAIPATPAGPSDTPNIHQGINVIVVPYWSDTNDWFAIADPNMVPTIEVGFYQGRQEPELFTQSDPTQGSMFNADVITYKIRHIYSGTVLDHRGFYRGQG